LGKFKKREIKKILEKGVPSKGLKILFLLKKTVKDYFKAHELFV
jgi:hypothetical protein